MTSQDTLAAIVLRERRKRAWSQDHLAKAAGLNLRTVQRVERGSNCSGETMQALAGALDIAMSRLTDRAVDVRKKNHFPALSSSQAKWVGAILCLPTVIFVQLNILYYEFGVSALAPIMESDAWNAAAGQRLALLLILGGPLAALLLVVPYLVKVCARVDSATMTISGLVIRWNTGQWLVGGLAAILLITLFSYGVIENFNHFMHANQANP